MALVGAPIMAALFMLFPRMAPLWGIPRTPDGAQRAVRVHAVGNIASLALDDAAFPHAFEVRRPPRRLLGLYFRGPVLSPLMAANGKPSRFVATAVGRRVLGPPANLKVQGPAVRYEVTLEPTTAPG
jgi:hypothetical protein